jgi:PAS domain-containing protein
VGQRVVDPEDAIPAAEAPSFAAPDDRLGWILEAIDAGITVQDAQLRLVFANQEAAELCD